MSSYHLFDDDRGLTISVIRNDAAYRWSIETSRVTLITRVEATHYAAIANRLREIEERGGDISALEAEMTRAAVAR